jgi:hypothetical protein
MTAIPPGLAHVHSVLNGTKRIHLAPSYHGVHGAVKPRVTLNSNEVIRQRLRDWMADNGRKKDDYAWLAELVDEDRGQIRKWVSGTTDSIPATFIAALESRGLVASRYLLTGEGSPEVIAPSEAVRRLRIIGKVAEGDVVGARELLTATPSPPTKEEAADLARASIAALGASKKPRRGQSRRPNQS